MDEKNSKVNIIDNKNKEEDKNNKKTNIQKQFQYIFPSFMMSSFNFSVTDKQMNCKTNKSNEKNNDLSIENEKSIETSENTEKNKNEDRKILKMELEMSSPKNNDKLNENNNESKNNEKSLNLEKIDGIWKKSENENNNDIIFVENDDNNNIIKKDEKINVQQENDLEKKKINEKENNYQINEENNSGENNEEKNEIQINEENLNQERDSGEENKMLGRKIREESPLEQDIQNEEAMKKQEKQELKLLDLVQKYTYGYVFNLVLKNCLYYEDEIEIEGNADIKNLIKEAGFQKVMSIVLAIGSLLGEQIMFVNKNSKKEDEQNDGYMNINNTEENNSNNQNQNEMKSPNQPEEIRVNKEQDLVNDKKRDYISYEHTEENKRELERLREREKELERQRERERVNDIEKPNEDMRIIHLDKVNENTIQNKLMSIEQKEQQKKEYEDTIQLEENNRDYNNRNINNNINNNINLFNVTPIKEYKEYKRPVRFEVKRPRKKYEDDENYNPYEDLMMQKNGKRNEDRFVVIDEQGRLKKRYSDGEESEEEEDDYGYRKRFRPPPPRKIEKIRNNPLKLAPTYKNLFTITNCQEQLKKQLMQIINSSIRHKHHDELADYLNESLRNKKFDTKGFKLETRGRKKKGARTEQNTDQGNGWNNFS